MVGGASGSIGAPLIEVTVQDVSANVAVGGVLGDEPAVALGEGLDGVQPIATIDTAMKMAVTRRLRRDGTYGSPLAVGRARGPA